MLKRVSLYLFATFVFSLQGALLASALYSALLALLILTVPAFGRDGGIAATVFYVFGASFLSAVIAFLASIAAKKAFGLHRPGSEPYYFVGIAALLANGIAASLVGIGLSPLHALIYLASILSVWIGARVYRGTWRKLDDLSAQPRL
jgi:hypothetical protein